MVPRDFPINMSHELMFQMSTQSVEAIQSYSSANWGYRNGVLMVVRVNELCCFLRILNHLFDDSWVTLHLPLLYNPSFSTPWASFAHFSFGEQEESPRVRVYLWLLREGRILFEFSRFFIPSKFVSEEIFFRVWKLKLLTQFSKTRHSFIKLQTFSFIEPHETHFFITDCKNLFLTESAKIHIGIEWDLFLHDP